MAQATQTAAQILDAAGNTDFANKLDEHFCAGYQMMYVPTTEEHRVEREITAVAKKRGIDVVTWDSYEGFMINGAPVAQGGAMVSKASDPKFKQAAAALEAVINTDIFLKTNDAGDYIFVFRDLDDFMVDPNVRRRIRSLVEGNKLANTSFTRPIVIVSPVINIPIKLRTALTVIDFTLPDEQALQHQVDRLQQSIVSKNPESAVLSVDLRQMIAMNLLGLTSNEAENCLSRCLVRHSGFKPEMIATIKEEKAAIVRKGDVLTYVPEHTVRSRAEIGGFDMLMKWLDERKSAYTARARELKIDPPRGIILLGIPGTGKSMVAKAACQLMGLPGYILDVGSLFGSLVGESEQRTRDVLRQIDAQNGCVLLIDEADKAMGNANSSTGDSGVTRRVFGQLLTWLADNKSRTFVIMTMNRTNSLPPEFLRAGRFDAIFYTDLPNPVERRQIFEIQFTRRDVAIEDLQFDENDWKTIVDRTDQYVGAEIEEIVRVARYKSLARNSGVPTFEELIDSIQSVVPMTQRDKEGLEEIRTFCKDKAMPVTSPPVESKGRARNSRSLQINKGGASDN